MMRELLSWPIMASFSAFGFVIYIVIRKLNGKTGYELFKEKRISRVSDILEDGEKIVVFPVYSYNSFPLLCIGPVLLSAFVFSWIFFFEVPAYKMYGYTLLLWFKISTKFLSYFLVFALYAMFIFIVYYTSLQFYRFACLTDNRFVYYSAWPLCRMKSIKLHGIACFQQRYYVRRGIIAMDIMRPRWPYHTSIIDVINARDFQEGFEEWKAAQIGPPKPNRFGRISRTVSAPPQHGE